MCSIFLSTTVMHCNWLQLADFYMFWMAYRIFVLDMFARYVIGSVLVSLSYLGTTLKHYRALGSALVGFYTCLC